MSVTYARFSSDAAARQASERMQEYIGDSGRVQLLRSARRLSHHVIPLRMTAVRIGTLFGGAAVGLLSLIALGACMWALSAPGEPLPAARETLAVCVGLSAILGCLAGALSFASDSSVTVQRLHEWLGNGKPVVLVEARQGHEQTMLLLGADVVGKMS